MHVDSFSIIDAHDVQWLNEIRTLFKSYEASLDTSLCFQEFKEELITLPGKYAPPEGCLLMAVADGTPAGCIALRSLGYRICEMKRLYIYPRFQGKGLGKRMVQEVIRRAREMGYTTMRLDTLPSMERAIALYTSVGFVDIEAYTHNPNAGVRYMELVLG